MAEKCAKHGRELERASGIAGSPMVCPACAADLYLNRQPDTPRPTPTPDAVDRAKAWLLTYRDSSHAQVVRDLLAHIEALTAEAVERENARATNRPMKNGLYPHLLICSGDQRKPLGDPGCVCDNRYKAAKAKLNAAERELVKERIKRKLSRR